MAVNETFLISLDIAAIPEDAIKYFERKDGSTGTNVKLLLSPLKTPDAFGNTHKLELYRSKTEKADGAPVVYVGKGKSRIWGDYNNQSYQSQNNNQNHNNDNDPPF